MEEFNLANEVINNLKSAFAMQLAEASVLRALAESEVKGLRLQVQELGQLTESLRATIDTKEKEIAELVEKLKPTEDIVPPPEDDE